MIAVKEHNRVFGESRVLEFLEPLGDLPVERGDIVVILRPIASHFWRVRVINGNWGLCRIVNQFVRPLANLALMRDLMVEHGEKRLSGLTVFPMRREYPLEDPNRVDKKDYFFGR